MRYASARLSIALLALLVPAASGAPPKPPKPLGPDEGVIAFVVDSAHGLGSVHFVREDRGGSFRVASSIAPGKTPLFIRLPRHAPAAPVPQRAQRHFRRGRQRRCQQPGAQPP